MIEFNSKTIERKITFADIKLPATWMLKYLNTINVITALVEVTICLDMTDPEKPALTCNGTIYDEQRNVLMYGQILEALFELSLKYDARFIEVTDIWIQYHMNNLSLGTESQFQSLYEDYKTGGTRINQLRSMDETFPYMDYFGLMYDMETGHCYGQITYRKSQKKLSKNSQRNSTQRGIDATCLSQHLDRRPKKSTLRHA